MVVVVVEVVVVGVVGVVLEEKEDRRVMKGRTASTSTMGLVVVDRQLQLVDSWVWVGRRELLVDANDRDSLAFDCRAWSWALYWA